MNNIEFVRPAHNIESINDQIAESERQGYICINVQPYFSPGMNYSFFLLSFSKKN